MSNTIISAKTQQPFSVNKSGATFSSIVGIGEKLKKLSEATKEEYLMLNRGVNAVCNIDLSEVIKLIDFNSNRIQVYPNNKGIEPLRDAINLNYFFTESDRENITITGGGMPAIDLTLQTLQLDKLYFANYFWGSYSKVAKIRGIKTDTYASLEELVDTVKTQNTIKREHCAVLICDPNNPLGNKIDDTELLQRIKQLNALGAIIIFDSPYRKLFSGKNDTFFRDLLQFENVIITESFSKSFGLSGQRIGFIHCLNKDFNDELNIRILYSANGINAFSQELALKLLTTPEGQKAVTDFKQKTVEDIGRNIQYLEHYKLLAEEFYTTAKPVGIFAVINKSEEELLKYRIGSISMNYFTLNKTPHTAELSRICVSVPAEKFKFYFDRILNT